MLLLIFIVVPDAHTSTEKTSCEFQQGWTKNVIGGLGGKIVKVTNLNASGAGSLREAIKTPGPRIVVFEVAGTIDLNGKNIKIRDPHITIAGQTAPSPGITLISGGIRIETHDVVVQHLRIRPGARGKKLGWKPDGINIWAGQNIIIDHNSISWAVDENLSASGPRFEGETSSDWGLNTSRNITFSNNIIAEALDDSTHPEGAHSKGSLIHDNVRNVLIYKNLYASNKKRNPLFKGGTTGAIINNFVVNPGSYNIRYSLISEEWTGKRHVEGKLFVVGNTMLEGSDSKKYIKFMEVRGQLAAYLRDNLVFDKKGVKKELIVDNYQTLQNTREFERLTSINRAENIASQITIGVGARPWDRDSTDNRIISESFSGLTRIIDVEPETDGNSLSVLSREKFDPASWDECMERLTL